MREIPKPFEKYRHFKGNAYQILCLAKDSETLEDVVVYQALYGEFQIYVRSLDMFMSPVDRMKYPDAEANFRFEKIDGSDMKTTGTVGSTGVMEGEGLEPATTGSMVQIHSEFMAMETTAEKASEVSPMENMGEDDGEINVDPAVLEFLDADTYGQKLNILASLKHRVTDDMITTMALASDLEVEEGPVEARYEQLKNCLLTKEKYECVRVR